MKSLFDHWMQSTGAPMLMSNLATEYVATIVLADGRTVEGVTAIERNGQTSDNDLEYQERKEYRKTVDFAADDRLSWGGMSNPQLEGKVLLRVSNDPDAEQELWNIEAVISQTKTFVRVQLKRRKSRERFRSGYKRDDE